MWDFNVDQSTQTIVLHGIYNVLVGTQLNEIPPETIINLPNNNSDL